MTSEHTPADNGRVVVGVDGSEPSKHALRWAQFMSETALGEPEHLSPHQCWASTGPRGTPVWPIDRLQHPRPAAPATTMAVAEGSDILGSVTRVGPRKDQLAAAIPVGRGVVTPTVGARGASKSQGAEPDASQLLDRAGPQPDECDRDYSAAHHWLRTAPSASPIPQHLAGSAG